MRILTQYLFILICAVFMTGCWESEALFFDETEFIDPSGNDFKQTISVRYTDGKTQGLAFVPENKWFRNIDKNGKEMLFAVAPADYTLRTQTHFYFTLIARDDNKQKPYSYLIARLGIDSKIFEHCVPPKTLPVTQRKDLRLAMRRAVAEDKSGVAPLNCFENTFSIIGETSEVISDPVQEDKHQTKRMPPAYKFDYPPSQIIKEAKAKRYLKTASGKAFLYSDFIGYASYKSGVRIKKSSQNKITYFHDYKNAASTIMVGFGAEYQPDGQLTSESRRAMNTLNNALNAYLKGSDDKPGAALKYGAFITAVNPIAPYRQQNMTIRKALSPEELAATQEAFLKAYKIETKDWKAESKDRPVPVGRYIVHFNDVNSGKTPRLLTLEDVISVLDKNFSNKRHILNRDQYIADAKRRLAALDSKLAADKQRLEKIDVTLVQLIEAQTLLQCGDFGLPLEKMPVLAQRVYLGGKAGKPYKFQNGKYDCQVIGRAAKAIF